MGSCCCAREEKNYRDMSEVVDLKSVRRSDYALVPSDLDIMEKVRNIFMKYDLNNDNQLSIEEVKEYLLDYHHSDVELEDFFFQIDTDNSGYIS